MQTEEAFGVQNMIRVQSSDEPYWSKYSCTGLITAILV